MVENNNTNNYSKILQKKKKKGTLRQNIISIQKQN